MRFLVALVLLLAACAPSPVAPSDASDAAVLPDDDAAAVPTADGFAPDAPVPSDAPPARDASVTAVDCVQGGPCPELMVPGDPYATDRSGNLLPAHGYADPSIRRDPATGWLWLAYSYVHSGDGVVHVDNHLAHSETDGASWRYDGALWTSAPQLDPRTGTMGYTNSETVSLAPHVTPGGTRWVSARMGYITQPGPGGGPDAHTFSVRVAEAATPGDLVHAAEAVLAGAFYDARLGPFVNLTTDAPAARPGVDTADLRGCTFFDAGVMFEGDRLFMAVECVLYTSTGEDTAHEFVAMFATTPAGAPTTWRWSYLGKLATHADAAALGGDDLLQAELAHTRDGALTVLLTPSHVGMQLATHDGCRALAVTSLDPPALAHDPAGAPVVLGDVRATDTGTGSCGYDPASRTGILVARRRDAPGVLVSTLAASGVRP